MENRTEPKGISEVSWFFKTIGILALGFIGGAVSPFIISWIGEVRITNSGDAVAVANTFIIFTTLIFVGFTVILGVAGYIFTQQFATSKETQIKHLINELEEMLKKGDSFGINFINQSMSNPDVRRHLETTLDKKVRDLIIEKNHTAQKEAEEFQKLADSVKSTP